MGNREELTTRLGRLSTRLRAAFAVGCAERVLCLCDLDRQPNDARIKAVIDLVWRFVAGEEPELDEIEAAEGGLRAAIPDPDLPDGSTPAYMACLALGFALDAIDESAVSGSFEALDSVDVFEDFFEPESRTWSITEQAWQMRALEACETAGALTGRELFTALNSHSPEWFRTGE